MNKNYLMTQFKTIKLDEVKNDGERRVLKLLNEKGKCFYGEIIKELSLSVDKGQKLLYSMLTKGLITHKNNTSFISLNVAIE